MIRCYNELNVCADFGKIIKSPYGAFGKVIYKSNGQQMEDISINGNGDVLYHDNKGYEDKWRKHHTSPIARDIWLKKDGKFSKLTSFAGEDRNPVWAADGQSYYYLSEQDGTFNIYINKVAGGNPFVFFSPVFNFATAASFLHWQSIRCKPCLLQELFSSLGFSSFFLSISTKFILPLIICL